MRPFVENFPFFSIFLAMTAGILLSVVRDGWRARRISVAVALAVAGLSAEVLAYTAEGDLSFTYGMGMYGAPLGNELKAGPLQAVLALTFSVGMAMSILGAAGTCSMTCCPKSRISTLL